MEKRTWISASGKTDIGKEADKSIAKTDYSKVRSLGVDDQGGGATIVTYELTGAWMDELEYRGNVYDLIDIPSAGVHTQPGHPAVPQEGLFVAVPPNAKVTGVKLLKEADRELDGKYNLIPVAEPAIEGQAEVYKPDPGIYGKDAFVPDQPFEFVGEKRVSGRLVAHILVFPAKYNPQTGKVVLVERMELEVTYDTKPGMDCVPMKRGQASNAILDSLILDAGTAFETEDKLGADADAKAAEPKKLKDPGNHGDFVIVTTGDLKDAFKNFIDIRNLDHTVKLALLDDIKKEFPATGDDVSIKDFLTYAYNNWALRPKWVILGGDVDKIPTHHTACATWNDPGDEPHHGLMASDHYYADISGDILPELLVGRFPASDVDTMKKICVRALAFGRHGSQWRDVIMLTTYQRNDYEQCKDAIAVAIDGEKRKDYNAALKYYGSDPAATKAKIIERLNERDNHNVAKNGGADIVNYRGHGSQTAWQASNGLNINDVTNLKTGSKTPLVLSICCLNNFIDWTGPCFGETWISKLKSAGFWGASRPSYTAVNHKFDKFLWEGIINERYTGIGEIAQYGTAKLWQNDTSDLAKQNIKMYLLLGDPTADAKKVKNYSVSFKGNDGSYASVSNSPDIATAKEITVEVMMRAESFNGGNWQDAVVSKHGPESGWELRVGEAIPRMMVTIGKTHYYAQPDDPSKSPKLKAKRWYHLAGTFDGKIIKMYVDGELWFSKSVKGNITQYNGDLVFAKNANPEWDKRWFQGDIASVALWNKARSQKEIQGDIFDNILADEIDRHNGLLGYWAMNEGGEEGAIVSDKFNVLYDQVQTSINILSVTNSGRIHKASWQKQHLNFYFTGQYTCGTKYGGTTGTWHDASNLEIKSDGDITYAGKTLVKPLIEANRIAWCIEDGNDSEGAIELMLGSDSRYFWPEGDQTCRLFQGWIRDKGPSGPLDFRGKTN
ncbi:Propeptide_C25 [Desulfatibacillum alkenivorans DSM 16219]|jgi:hypothetical protein|uniref:Propeptide_C25 n=1 Tax=Desulfatibacillum alkenivorans DSM 16219 TaxID=1121393 RepID=A0A1M6CD39_9BACT|nr:C25 family cysteine peptidase [Desulfatibacillum alkenivorans]SHI58674.1 Propeptide_C25 [Desulfatibacillum alkenivorans DSM 16219]